MLKLLLFIGSPQTEQNRVRRIVGPPGRKS
jgi:hypothetical protein